MENHRLVLIPPPFQGHMTPMLQLATILHSKGFSITIAHTQFNPPDPRNHPSFTFLPFSDGLSNTHTISSKNFVDVTSTLNTHCASSLKEVLVRMKKENANQEKIACIIYDGLMYFTDSVARELKIPSILFRTTSAANFLTYHMFAQLQSNGYLPLQGHSFFDSTVPWKDTQITNTLHADSRSFDLVPELDPFRFKDLPIFNLTNPDVMLQQIYKTIAVKPSLGVICNTVDSLEGSSLTLNKLRQLYQVRFFPIGPLHMIAEDFSSSSFLKEDYNCIAWLNKQAKRSVLYLSLGSIASWDQNELDEVAWGLVNSGQRFLWVIRPGTINHDISVWIESLPEDVKKAVEERGHIVKWAPQREVLAHQAVGGFWSHCGWNSTLESLSEGVPIICQPCFGDQRVNARMLTHVWRVGLEWSNIMVRDDIERAVRRLMVSAEGKEMGQKAQELKDKISLAVRDDGSSSNALNGLVESILSAP